MDEIDALVISTPPFAHAAIIEAALKSGKHVLTEKPFVMTVDDGERLLRLARAQGRQLAIVHNFQFARSFKRLLADIDQNFLGKVRTIQAIQLSNPRRRLPEWYEALPGGLFFDESPHLLYLLRRLLPNLELEDRQITWTDAAKKTPRYVHATFRSENAVPAMIHMNFQASVSEWQVLVHGERAMGSVDLFRDIYIRIPNDGAHQAKAIVATSAFTILQHIAGTLSSGIRHLAGRLDYGNDELFERFADAIRSNERPLHMDGEDALRVLRLQMEILRESR
jgi:predicted dehydrogenase